MMNTIIMVIFATLITTTTTTSSSTTTADNLLINCGLPKHTMVNSSDNRLWWSDDNSTFSPTNLDVVTSPINTSNSLVAPYSHARKFKSSFTYSFPISPGPKFLRLFFSSTTPPNLEPSQFSLSLQANAFTLFNNFNPFLDSKLLTLIRSSSFPVPALEFHLVLDQDKDNAPETRLNLTFSPGDNCDSESTSCYGFVNGIEIITLPSGLYVDPSKVYRYVNSPGLDYSLRNVTALQTAYRLNVGGPEVVPVDDTGLGRPWYKDDDYLVEEFSYEEANWTATMAYKSDVAPRVVYVTERNMGNDSLSLSLGWNLTWRFEVDAGFDYLVRLHFCDMNASMTGGDQRVFQVYINDQIADGELDVWLLSGGTFSPTYTDYVVHINGVDGSDGDRRDNNITKTSLWLALHPLPTSVVGVLLNGLEILKLQYQSPQGNHAVPQSYTPGQNQTPSDQKGSTGHHHSLTITIVGVLAGGTLLVTLIVMIIITCVAIVIYNKRKRAKNTSITSDNSCHCQRFSLTQIKVATSDFNDHSIIGSGGFGKVYKGVLTIKGEETIVAIKRLSSSSKQGANEFCTEIEMLSRLRHVNLVSLIGYCDDQGEMILVYDYIPRGTLRRNLKSNSLPSWKQRLMICIGAARGIHYLHSCVKPSIIHRDIKSSNILLDGQWTAKVSDFGLSKVGPADIGIDHVSTAVKGTIGYLDPEYYLMQRLTDKSDVYSFGVVLFEVLCARPAIDPNLPREQANLAAWARSCYKSGALDAIVDTNIMDQIAPACLSKFGDIAEMCIRDQGSERPFMGDVIKGLELALQLQQIADENALAQFFGSYDTNVGNTIISTSNHAVEISIGSISSEILDQGR